MCILVYMLSHSLYGLSFPVDFWACSFCKDVLGFLSRPYHTSTCSYETVKCEAIEQSETNLTSVHMKCLNIIKVNISWNHRYCYCFHIFIILLPWIVVRVSGAENITLDFIVASSQFLVLLCQQNLYILYNLFECTHANKKSFFSPS